VSAVSEWIAREYFESLGYLVSQPRKYIVPGRQKKADEEVDLVILNPRVKTHRIADDVIWSDRQLKTVAKAVVGVRGWHTERFYTSTFEQSPDILRFTQPDSVKFAGQLLGEGDMAKILCLPRLPVDGDLKDQAITRLRKSGIDGVVTFRTMLHTLVAQADTKKNYEKSDLMQIIRLLKNYDLLKDPQMELFSKRRRKRSGTPKASSAGTETQS
jgi:hypothetical protein